MKRFAVIAAALWAAFLYLMQPATAQTFTVTSCPAAAQVANAGQTGRPVAIDIFGNTCTSGSGGGGGGGLSVTDRASWTQATSPFTPGGCVFNDTATLTAGLQGTFRCNANRALLVDVDAGSSLATILSNPLATQAGTVSIGGVNILGINSAAALAGNGLTGTGSLRVTVASDNSAVLGFGVAATGGAVPANASYNGLNVGGNLVGQIGDPCQTVAKNYTPISITTATTTRIIAPTASKKTYICYMFLKTAAANNIAVVEGTGGTCGAGTAGVVGGTTAANGLNDAANDGQAFGNGGYSVLQTAGTNVDFCLITSAATPLAGGVMWVAQHHANDNFGQRTRSKYDASWLTGFNDAEEVSEIAQ